ncbi:unnamed protein product [Rhizophagus irregularis]|nr:unnamed protein product [Rhizophagus irregularis]CAB4435062.1 unnamed protein product [Rhizophagus irregularis]
MPKRNLKQKYRPFRALCKNDIRNYFRMKQFNEIKRRKLFKGKMCMGWNTSHLLIQLLASGRQLYFWTTLPDNITGQHYWTTIRMYNITGQHYWTTLLDNITGQQ